MQALGSKGVAVVSSEGGFLARLGIENVEVTLAVEMYELSE